MEGLSAFTTVTSVLDTAWKVISYVKAVAGANEDRKLLLRELIRARGLLSTLRDLQTEGKDEEWSRALQNLSGDDGALQSFKAVLEDMMTEGDIERVLVPSASPRQTANPNTNSSLLSRIKSRLQQGKSTRAQGVNTSVANSPQNHTKSSPVNTATFVTAVQNAVGDLKWPFTQPHIGELMHKLERIKSEFLLALSSDNIRLCKLIRDDISAVHDRVQNVSDGVQTLRLVATALREHQDGSEKWTRQQELIFLRKLEEHFSRKSCPEQIDYLTRHATWLSANDTFRRWQHSGGSLFLTGPAGIGKTSICQIVDSLLHTKGSPSDICVVPVYFQFSRREVQTLQAVFAYLVEDMIHAYPRLQKYYNKLILTGEGELEVSDSLRIIHRAQQDFEQFYIILDALDECDDGVALDVVKRLTGLRGPPNIFATSRREGMLGSHFSYRIQSTTMTMHAKESAALLNLLGMNPSTEGIQAFTTTLLGRVGGRFGGKPPAPNGPL